MSRLNELDGEIVEYEPSMAKGVADMLNKFKESWPGGFGGGVPFTEETVEDWMDESSSIVDYVALDEEGVPVGFCNLEPHWREEHAAYIGLLGVIQRVKGQKYGKRLLLKCVEKASEEGIERVDLHTWSGNLRAVPLYKKVGMLWVPDTTVYMQDYIPLLHQNDLTKEWLETHPDWYEAQQRELKQEPDDMTVGGMKIYRYRFGEGDDWMEVDIDRYGWGITGICRKLGHEEISVKAEVRSHDIHIGIKNSYSLTIENDTGEEKEIQIDLDPFTGLNFMDDIPSSIKIADGEIKTVSSEFVVSKEAEAYGSTHEASETIDTLLKIDDKEIELKTGGKIQPAVKVNSQRDLHHVFPDKKTDLYFDLKNNTEKELKGELTFKIKDEEGRIDFSLDDKEISGIKLPVELDFIDEDVVSIEITPSIQIKEDIFPMKAYVHPLVKESDEILVSAEKEEEVFLVNGEVKVKAELEGGTVKVSEVIRDSELPFEISQQIGPPFGRTEDSTLMYEYDLTQEGDHLHFTLQVESVHRPGILIKKHIRLKKRSSEVEFWSELENLDDVPLKCATKTNTRRWDFDIEPYQSRARKYTPLDHEIIESDPITDMLSSTMMPQDPNGWEETWTAYEDFGDGAVSGMIWDKKNIKKVKLGKGALDELKSITKTLRPGESFVTSHLWITVKKPSLNSFRDVWNRKVGKMHMELDQRIYGKKIRKNIDVRLDDNVLEAGKILERTLIIDKAVNYPMPGEYTIHASQGLDAKFTNGGKIKISQEEDKKELRLPLDLEARENMKSCIADISIHFSGEREIDFELPMMIIDDCDIKVEPRYLEGKKVLHVDNGKIQFDVLDGFGGGLIRLVDDEKNTYLADNFPEPEPKSWFENLMGGVEPRFITPDDFYSFYEIENVSSSMISEGRWKGVKVDYEIEKHDNLRGQNFSVKYLTLPGIKLIKIVLVHKNPKAREVNWVGELFMDVLLNGSLEGTLVEFPGKHEEWIWSNQTYQFSTPSNIEKPWFRFRKGEVSLSGFAVEGARAFSSVTCNREINMAFLISNMFSGPGAREEIELGIALDISKKDINKARKAMKSNI